MRPLVAALLVAALGTPGYADAGLRRLAGQDLAHAAEGFVRQTAGVVVLCDVTIPDQQVPTGTLQLSPHWAGSRPALEGRIVVPVSIVVNGVTFRDIGIPCRCSLSVSAPAVGAAARPTAAGVRPGDPVTVVTSDRGGALQIEIPATARDAGAVGVVIRVELTATHHMMTGHVSADHTVVVP